MSVQAMRGGAEERGRAGGANTIPMKTLEMCEYFFPRLLYFGLDWGDLVRALKDVKKTNLHEDWDDWHDQFARLARSYEEAGADAEARGKRATARLWFTKASACYHFAEFMYFDNPAVKLKTRKDVTRAFERARPHMDCSIEPTQIPHAGQSLPGYLYRSGGDARPCVILVNGLDSAKEVELHAFAMEFVSRGLSALVFDGPGQGLLAGTVPMVLDFERVIGDVLSVLRRHEAIDGGRIGIFGVSYGGYLAARSAAFHPGDIRACINLSGTHDADNFPRMTVNVRKDLMFVFGVNNEDEMNDIAQSRVNLRDVPGIKAPLLTIHGKEDGVFPYASCLRLMSWARGEKELISYDGERHAAINCFADAVPRLADWMAEKLA